MATQRQIQANRRNATLGRGPKSLSGKARSRVNALRHGLAARPDEVRTFEIEAFACALAAASKDTCLTDARKAAEAQIDLLRIRDARVRILERKAWTASADPGEYEAIATKLPALASLDRYERRALAKRKKAVRALFARID
jgi:hypothetical protein